MVSKYMTTLLIELEKISSITGELAIYQKSGILAVVRIERIIVEPNLLSFRFVPENLGRFGLENQEAFSISSRFNDLDFSDGRYTSSIDNWVLETNPVRVLYVSELIVQKTRIEEILPVFKVDHKFCDEMAAKIVTELMQLKNQIQNRKISLISKPKFKGQSWGGADVIVLSKDDETKKSYSHFSGVTVISSYATEIGDLFRKILSIVGKSPNYHYLSKYMLWGEVGLAASSVDEDKSTAILEEICHKVIMTAIDFITLETRGYLHSPSFGND